MRSLWDLFRRFSRGLLKSSVAGWCTIGMIGLAIAGTGYPDFLKAIAQRESSLNPSAVNAGGYTGLFQMGTLAMTDAGYYRPNGTRGNSWAGTFTGKNGLTSIAQFKASPDLQIKAITDYYTKLQGYINSFNLTQYVGRTINGVQLTTSGLIAGAHLVGIGKLKQYLESGGTNVPRDGNQVPITEYITKFGGYSVSSVAPTFSQVMGANPSGSVPANPTPPGPGTGGLPGSSTGNFPKPPSFANSDEAFLAYSGYTMSQTGQSIKQFFAALLFLWLAYVSFGAFQTYKAGKLLLKDITRSNIRAMIVVMVFIVILM